MTSPNNEGQVEGVQSKKDRAREVLETVLGHLETPSTISVSEDDECILLEVDSEENDFIIGSKGSTLEAIQFIVNKVVNRFPRDRKKVVVDVAGYRSARKELLTTMSNELIEKVKKLKRAVMIYPMTAWDRRLVHLAASEDEEISTHSEGHGVFRRLLIIPKEDRG